MNAAAIARALGGAHREGSDWRATCPVHGGKTLIITDGRNGQLVVKCFGGCDWRDVFDELRARGLIAGKPGTPNPEREEERRKQEAAAKAEIERIRRRICQARDVYLRAQEAARTPVETYLRSRGITLPIPQVLCWLRLCPHRSGKFLPAMVAAIVDRNGDQIAVHKTFLRPDGANKAALPKEQQRETCGPMKGGAVRLASPRPDCTLLVGEGIETVLSAMQLFELPGWAAICAGGIEALDLPRNILNVTIAADSDASLTGQRAALIARERWEREGRHVEILAPPAAGMDFNDILQAAGKQ